MGFMAMTRDGCGLALGGLLLVAATATGAHALPQCAPATPAQISTPKQYVDNAWQKYRGPTPEHRCCAKPCEPIIRFAARIETNALMLNAVARNPKVQEPEHSRALANANALFSKRSSLAFEFLRCYAETAPRGTGPAARCGETSVPYRTLSWYAWCDAFAARMEKFRNLLVATVGDNVGSWRVQTNLFRIGRLGFIDEDSARIEGNPLTRLPAGKSTIPFLNLTLSDANHLPALPVSQAVLPRMYMRYTASAVRLPGPAGTKALDTSPLIDGVCPGLPDRPTG